MIKIVRELIQSYSLDAFTGSLIVRAKILFHKNFYFHKRKKFYYWKNLIYFFFFFLEKNASSQTT